MRIYSVKYQPIGTHTQVVEIIAADDEKSALGQIIPKGIPVSIEPATSSNRIEASREYKQQFLTAILFHVESGLSAGKALEEIIKAETGPIRPQLNPGLYILLGGGSFSDAMEALGMYDSATIAVLRAGEQIGAMAQALQSASDHYEKVAASKKLMFGVLFTLSIDIVLSVFSTLSIQFGFLPMVKKQGIQASPEVAAEFYRNLDIAFLLNGFLSLTTVVGIAAIIFLVYAYKQTGNAALRYKVDRQLASTPFIKDVFSHSGVSMTFTMCATLLKGGVPLHNAIQIIRGISLSPLVEEYWKEAGKKLETGEPVALALKSPLLDTAETLIISAHKDSAQLAKAFQSISVRRDELSTKANKKFGLVAFAGAMIYSSISVLIALWAAYLQYQSMMASMMSMGG